MPEVDKDRRDFLNQAVDSLYDECKARIEAVTNEQKMTFAEFLSGKPEELKEANDQLNKSHDDYMAKIQSLLNQKRQEIEEGHWNMKKIGWTLAVVAIVFVIALIGGSFYMLDYSLAPDPNRLDTDSCYRQQFEKYPESKVWVDSLRSIGALRDTFLTMPTGERHHAFYMNRGSTRTALVIHGWRDCAIKFFWLARIYEHELGYNVVIPDLHACGESEGDAIQMGWKDRLDALHWLKTFQADTMVVHGVSMGAATTMMLSGEEMPDGIKDLRFVEDCGYTSVWDEFAGQLKEQFGLPPFPLMYATSLLCQLCYGWNFSEASALEQVRKCQYPMLFIHGSTDTFVPTAMVYPLYEAKPGTKALWIADGAEHALSYHEHKAEYISRLRAFCLDQ